MPTTGGTPDVAFVELLLAGRGLVPDELPLAAAEAGRRLGGRDVELWLVDLAQRGLHHMTPPGVAAGPPLSLEGTAAGNAYRTERPVDVPAPHGGRRLWVPLHDSAERLGVLGATVDGPAPASDGTIRRWGALAALVGELVVSKDAYGDRIALTRRSGEVALAAEMRWALLPPLTFSSSRVTVSGILEPAYEIAGDCFDYAVNGDVVHLAVLDAIGHGMEASRMASVAVATYRNLRRTGTALDETIMGLDRVVAEQFGESRFVTGQIATLEVGTGALRLINAGHPRPVLFRDGRDVGDLPCAPCRPVGLGAVPTTVTDVALQPGDLVLFHTDGITEARAPDGRFFGRQRLVDHATRHLSGNDTLAEVLRQLVQAVLEHEDGQLRDDATLLAVHWAADRGGTPVAADGDDRLTEVRGGRPRST